MFDKVTSGDFTITYGSSGDDFIATNGTDTQAINDPCIFYADNNLGIWMDETSIHCLGVDSDNKTFNATLSDNGTITITKTSSGVNVNDGTVNKTFPVPTWAYIPKSTGAFGFFESGTEVQINTEPICYVGTYAGVDCYNSINKYDLPISIDATITDNVLSGAKWIKPVIETDLTPFNPDDITITPLNPLNPIVIDDPIILNAVPPTPTYTDGDWGYNLISGGDNDGKAVIVSYSGAGGDIVIPAKVGGYDVAELGIGNTNEPIFNSSNLPASNTLTITPGPNKINAYAFASFNGSSGVDKLQGDIIIPNTITTIADHAFYFDDGYDTLLIPESVTSIGNQCFQGNTIHNLISLMDSGSVVGFKGFKFYYTQNILSVLDLGTLDLSTVDTSNFQYKTIDDEIPCMGYLAPYKISAPGHDNGPTSVLLNTLPLLCIIGVLMFAVGFTIYRRMD